MTIRFEGTVDRRKELAQALADATGIKAEYRGTPSFAYRVGEYTVHRDGNVEANDLTDIKEIGIILQALRGRGFVPAGNEWSVPEDAPTEQELLAASNIPRGDRIALSFPKDGLSAANIANVKKLVAAKATLIKLALEIDDLSIEEDDARLTFAWLPLATTHEMVEATSYLLAAIIKLAKKLRYVTAVERETDNPRYAFRCFLLRLGFIGSKYKNIRKYLMQGIPGDGSKRHQVIEFDAATDTPSNDAPADVYVPEKLEASIIEEETSASKRDVLNEALEAYE